MLLTILLPALGIVVFSGLKTRHDQIDKARGNALLLAQSLAAYQEQLIMATRQMLSTLAELPQVQRLDLQACNELFGELLKKNPQYSTIAMATPDGIMVAASQQFKPGSVKLGDRRHIVEVIRTLDFSAGEYIVGRLSKSQSLNFTYPVLDENRNLIAIVIAGVKLDKIAGFLSQVKLPEGFAVTLTDHAGVRLLRLPENDRASPGKPVPADSLKRASGTTGQGVFERTGEDGIERVYAFKQLRLREEAPPYLYVFVGMPKEQVLQRANATMLNNLLILGLSALLAAALALIFGSLLVTRPISRLVASAQRLGRGEVGARTGLPHADDELGQLALAFDEMATLLEEREKERQRAENALLSAFAELEIRVQERTAELKTANETLKVQIDEREWAENELAEKNSQLHETVQQLEETTNTLQLIIESIPVRVFWKDRELRFSGCNTLFARDAGLSRPEQLLGLDDFAMGWKEQAELYRQDDLQVMESGLPKINIIEPQTTPTGAKIWLNTSKVPLRLHDGEVIGVLGVYEDITEHRLTAEALRQRESYLTAIIENQPGLLWLKDTESRFLSVNRAFARSCDSQRPEEIVGKTDLDIWPPELAEKYRNDDKEVMAKQTSIIVEERIFDQGVLKWFQTFKTPVLSADGQILGTCGFALDVTERKQADEVRSRLEERLQRAEKMEALGTLAGGVAHDLNNVLGIVVGYSELLLYDLSTSSSARSKALEIMKGGQRAAAIVQDLLTLARRGVSNREVLNLNNIVSECQNSPEFSKICSYHPNVRIKTDLEAHLLNVSGSAVHLGKSLLNLVSNAAEAMSEGGEITIKTGCQYLDKPVSGYDEIREGDYVVLSVSDTGEGIPSSDLKHVFEPFYTKKVMGRSGTGLGLSVVWGTVKDHDGYINVESEEGKGTTFILYFPVTREEISQEKVLVSAAELMGNGESVLVVDDVREQRELACTMLRKLNYTVVSVSSGEEAVEYLKKNSADLIVLDMIMDPGMDGLDTYAKILEIHPNQKAIIVSGFSETERVSKARDLGAGSYIKKPYMLEKLGLAVRKELD